MVVGTIGPFGQFLLHERRAYAPPQLNAVEDQIMPPISVAVASASTPDRSAWLKNAARVAFLLCLVKGTAWLAMSWLALRGFNNL
jgi:hypothetical protein